MWLRFIRTVIAANTYHKAQSGHQDVGTKRCVRVGESGDPSWQWRALETVCGLERVPEVSMHTQGRVSNIFFIFNSKLRIYRVKKVCAFLYKTKMFITEYLLNTYSELAKLGARNIFLSPNSFSRSPCILRSSDGNKQRVTQLGIAPCCGEAYSRAVIHCNWTIRTGLKGT